jgi:plastocyanin
MSKNRSTVTNYVILPSALAVTVSLILVIMLILTHNAIAQQEQTSASTVKVQAGGGNSTLPYTIFNPQSVQVKTGQSVMWYNPSIAPEPHTVTFALDNKTKPDLSATFAVRNSSSFIPIPSNSTSEPVIIPNRQNPSMSMILGSNAIASNPTVIDSTGNIKHLSHNAAYSVKGNEKLVNSGLVFPKGMGPPNGSTSFTLTFEKAGTYNYYCILHPWQKGKVVIQ